MLRAVQSTEVVTTTLEPLPRDQVMQVRVLMVNEPPLGTSGVRVVVRTVMASS